MEPGRAGVPGLRPVLARLGQQARAVCTAAATIYVLTDPALASLVTTHLCLRSPIFIPVTRDTAPPSPESPESPGRQSSLYPASAEMISPKRSLSEMSERLVLNSEQAGIQLFLCP